MRTFKQMESLLDLINAQIEATKQAPDFRKRSDELWLLIDAKLNILKAMADDIQARGES